MPDIKKTLKEVVVKTTKTMEIPKESTEKMSKFAEEMKKAATTSLGKKG
jgi:hypothetical protein